MPTEQNKILDGLKQQLTTASQTLSSMSAPKISASSLTSPVAPFQIPQYTPPAQTPFVPAPLTQATQTAQTALDASQADLSSTYDKLGTQLQRKQQLETAQGIPAINSRLSELNALDAQYAAELTGITANELKQNVTGDLATNYAPLRNAISAQDTRLNIQKQQSVNIKRATNAAATAAATGQLALAQEYVQKALDAEFEPLKYQLEYKKMIYDRNKDTFNAAEQRQFEAVLKADERKYEEQKTNRENVLNIMSKLAANGTAPSDIMQSIQKVTDPAEAFRIAAPYMRDPNEILQGDLMREQILTQKTNRSIAEKELRIKQEAANIENLTKRAGLGDTAALKALGISTQDNTPKVRLTAKEAITVQKDLSNDDNFKALTKSSDTLRSLVAYEQQVRATGANSLLSPVARGKTASIYQTAILNAKEYFNLGVLNGPDQSILMEVIPSANTKTPFAPVRATSVLNGIENMKKQLGDKLDSDYLAVSSRFSNYSPEQVPGINDAKRQYIQTKISLDPKIAQFVADNPTLTPDEVIQVINSRL